MILELASFLGTSVGGKLFGMAGDFLAERREQRRDELEYEHKKDLAFKGQLKEHYESVSKQQPDGTYSPLTWCIAFVIVLFAITYCYATLSCFTDSPEQIIYTKDPSSEANTFSLLFGTISWDISNDRILAMSKAGMGYLLCYPIIFILSMVATGDKPRKR
jgi:hypothetical protein